MFQLTAPIHCAGAELAAMPWHMLVVLVCNATADAAMVVPPLFVMHVVILIRVSGLDIGSWLHISKQLTCKRGVRWCSLWHVALDVGAASAGVLVGMLPLMLAVALDVGSRP